MRHPAWAATARTGPLRRYKQLVFFACEGLVALYDERKPEEDYSVLRPSDLDERAGSLAAFAKKGVRTGDNAWLRQESREMLQAAQDMLDTAKEARHMGDPSDPQVQAFWSRHRRNDRVSFSFKPTAPGQYEKIPDLPDAFQAAAADAKNRIRQKPTRKPRSRQQIVLPISSDLL